ncbi:hypothetical protein GGF31_003804 [Allomyces arbusculus]|nr:hypothetical protein GGF31_003804 [Allomyces arbusculus]
MSANTNDVLKNDVLKIVRASPDVNLIAFDAVIIDSWNGDSYVGIDLELIVSKFGAIVLMLAFLGYVLCVLAEAAMAG